MEYLSTHEIMPSSEDTRKKIVLGSSSRMLQMHFLLSRAHTHRAGFFCAFLKNSRGENSSFFRNSRPKTQGLFQNSRYWRFLTKFSKKLKVSEIFIPIFQTWIFCRILRISSETRYQRYQLIAILQIEACFNKKDKFWKKNSVCLRKNSTNLKKLKDFLKNSRKNSKLKQKTQGFGKINNAVCQKKRLL